jgi:hypothetical protein
MRGADRSRDLPGDLQGDLGRKLTSGALEPLRQRFTFEILHDDISRAIRKMAVLMDLNDARVVNPIDRARFVEEAGQYLGIAGVIGVQHLDGDAALDGLIYALVYRAHAALSEQADDTIGTDQRAEHLLPRIAWDAAAEAAAASEAVFPRRFPTFF